MTEISTAILRQKQRLVTRSAPSSYDRRSAFSRTCRKLLPMSTRTATNCSRVHNRATSFTSIMLMDHWIRRMRAHINPSFMQDCLAASPIRASTFPSTSIRISATRCTMARNRQGLSLPTTLKSLSPPAYWTTQNKSNSQPAANPGNLPASTYFMASGTFVRINNVTLGYTVQPNVLARQKVITSMRVFVDAQNPVTLKKYGGFSSELPGSSPTNAGIELGTYPTTRTFAAGINLGF